MKPSIVIAIILCTQIIHAEDTEYIEPYKTGISMHYGRSMVRGFEGKPVIVVSEEAITPLVFDLSLLVTGDEDILKGNPGVGLGAIQVGCRGTLLQVGFLNFSVGISGGGVVLKEIEEDRESIVTGGIVSGIHEVGISLPHLRISGKIGLVKMRFNDKSQMKLIQKVPNIGTGVFTTVGIVLEVDN
jgi:hypothetical protein